MSRAYLETYDLELGSHLKWNGAYPNQFIVRLSAIHVLSSYHWLQLCGTKTLRPVGSGGWLLLMSALHFWGCWGSDERLDRHDICSVLIRDIKEGSVKVLGHAPCYPADIW